MEIPLKDIPDQGLDITYGEDPHLLGLIEDLAGFDEKITVRGRVSKAGETVFLAGWLTTRLILQCSRCLKGFALPLYLELATQFVPIPQAPTTRPGKDQQDIPMADDEIHFYKGQSVLLDDFVREEVILAIPMQPLCDSNCHGLCSRCGRDLNLEICNCPQEEAAPPMTRTVKSNKKIV
jgi:DUF177 domain-containing protein